MTATRFRGEYTPNIAANLHVSEPKMARPSMARRCFLHGKGKLRVGWIIENALWNAADTHESKDKVEGGAYVEG